MRTRRVERLCYLLSPVALAFPLACSIPDRSLSPPSADSGLPSDAASPVDSGPSSDAGPESGDVAAAEFTLRLLVSQVSVRPGGTAKTAVTVVPAAGFAGAVTVTAVGLPAGITADSLVVPSGATVGTLTLRAASGVPFTPEVLQVYVVGASGGFIAPAVSLRLVVPGPPGTLDATFGTNGIETIPLDALEQTGSLAGLTVQPDGKIVYGGSYGEAYSSNWTVLGRLNSDGTPDTTFNPSGTLPGAVVELPTWAGTFVAQGQGAVQVLPSGDILVGGHVSLPSSPWILMVSEFTAGGGLDPSFPSSGIDALWGETSWDQQGLGGLLVLPGGEMILGGGVTWSSFPVLVKLLANGEPDTSFDPLLADGGAAAVAYPGPDAGPYNKVSFGPLALLPNGDVLGGLGGTGLPLALAISSTTGQIDTNFGPNGDGTLLGPTAPPFAGVVQGIATGADGSALFLGSTATTIELTRFSADGKLDSTFGTEGLASPSFPGGNASAGSFVLASDGTIVVGATLPGISSIGVVRYTPQGALDATFNGGAGYAGVPPQYGGSSATGGTTLVTLDASGRIVVGFMIETNSPALQFARFWP